MRRIWREFWSRHRSVWEHIEFHDEGFWTDLEDVAGQVRRARWTTEGAVVREWPSTRDAPAQTTAEEGVATQTSRPGGPRRNPRRGSEPHHPGTTPDLGRAGFAPNQPRSAPREVDRAVSGVGTAVPPDILTRSAPCPVLVAFATGAGNRGSRCGAADVAAAHTGARRPTPRDGALGRLDRHRRATTRP